MSYGFNGALNGFGRTGPVPFCKLSQLQGGGQAIIVWEVDETYNGGANIYNDGSNYPSEGITKCHGTGAIVSYVDGHVGWIPLAEYANEVNKQPSKLWCVPASLSVNGN